MVCVGEMQMESLRSEMEHIVVEVRELAVSLTATRAPPANPTGVSDSSPEHTPEVVLLANSIHCNRNSLFFAPTVYAPSCCNKAMCRAPPLSSVTCCTTSKIRK